MSEFDYEKGREEFQHARVKVKELEAHESCPCKECVASGFREGEAATRARFAALTEAARAISIRMHEPQVCEALKCNCLAAQLRAALEGK